MFQLRWVFHNLKGYRKYYITALVFSLLSSAIAIINPRFSQMLIDDVLIPQRGDRLLPILGIMLVLHLTRLVIRYLMIIWLEKSTQHMMLNIRTRLYDVIQKQDMCFFDKTRTGDLMTRMTGDLDMVRHTGAYVIYALFDSILLFLGATVFLLFTNWVFTLAMLAVTPLVFVVTRRFSKTVRPIFHTLRERLSRLNTAAQENISGNRVVKAFAREQYEMDQFDQKNKDFYNANLKAATTWLKFFPIIEACTQSMSVISVLFGGLFIIQGSLTPGELMAFSSLTWAIALPMRNIGPLLNDLQRFSASASKVIELYYAQPTIVSRHDAVDDGQPIKGSISFEDVSFSFQDNEVLRHINLNISPGQTVAIMGPTGSGKTTLVSLLSRFYDVSGGRVLVDGIDVRMHHLDKLRKSIAYASQEVFLFSDTAEGNIAYGAPDLSFADVKKFAVAADADSFVSKMEKGYDTIVGERGVGMSGGQKQRLALARALAVRPPILVLDDTTSAVDLETEKYIQNQLAELDFPCTKIMIAQRISTAKQADVIVVLQDGTISEMGTHEQLLAQKGYYFDTFRLQNGEADLDDKAGDLVGA